MSVIIFPAVKVLFFAVTALRRKFAIEMCATKNIKLTNKYHYGNINMYHYSVVAVPKILLNRSTLLDPA